MKKNLYVIAGGIFLTACTSPTEKCAGYGFKPGSTEYANCQMEVDAQRKKAAAAFSKASGNMGVMNKPFPQQTSTSCRRAGRNVYCNSTTY